MSFKIEKIIPFVFCVLTAAVLFVFAWNLYPLSGGDALFFVTPAIQLRNQHELTSPLFIVDSEINKLDPNGSKKFLYYFPLFPMIVSLLGQTSRSAYLALAILDIVTLSLSCFLFYKILNLENEFKWQHVLALVMGVLAMAGSLDIGGGRPETLAKIWILLAMIAWFYFSSKKLSILWGLLLGLMFGTHFVGGIISSLILGIYLGYKYPLRESLKHISLISALAIPIFLIILFASPLGIKETLNGVVIHGFIQQGAVREEGGRFNFSNLENYFLKLPGAPFYGLAILLFVFAVFKQLWENKSRIASLLVFSISALGVSLLFADILYTSHVFYAVLFSPIIFGSIIFFYNSGSKKVKFLVLVTMFLVGTGFLRNVALFPFFLKEKSLYAEARQEFNMLDRNKKIGLSSSLWVLTNKYENIYIYTPGEGAKSDTGYIFLQQRYLGLKIPPPIYGCKIKEDNFRKEIPQVFGFKLGNTMPGYGYALYSCN